MYFWFRLSVTTKIFIIGYKLFSGLISRDEYESISKEKFPFSSPLLLRKNIENVSILIINLLS